MSRDPLESIRQAGRDAADRALRDTLLSKLPFEEWLRLGWERGWCGPPVCATCDGVPATEAEWEDASCLHVIRLYEDADQAAAVIAEHSPSVWRATNRGWSRP